MQSRERDAGYRVSDSERDNTSVCTEEKKGKEREGRAASASELAGRANNLMNERTNGGRGPRCSSVVLSATQRRRVVIQFKDTPVDGGRKEMRRKSPRDSHGQPADDRAYMYMRERSDLAPGSKRTDQAAAIDFVRTPE